MAKRAGNLGSAEVDYHAVGARLRVTGSGNLQMQFTDLAAGVDILVPIAMQATTAIEPTRLANFQSQRMRFEGITTEINEVFVIRRLVLYVKEVAVEYPM